MLRVRTWTLSIGMAGMAVFVAAVIFAAYVYTRLPQHPGSGAGFIAVIVAWYAYLLMSACTVTALAGMALARFKTSLPLERGQRRYLLAAAVCQLAPLVYSAWSLV